MRAIAYMLRKTAKNWIIDTMHHPLQLIVYLFIIFTTANGMLMAFTSSSNMEMESDDILDIRLLMGAYLLVLYFVSMPVLLKTLTSSSTFFKMSDVSNVFTAPISEKKILAYGVGRQMATILVLLLCFFSYGAMVVRLFDISAGMAVVLMCGIALILFEVQLISVLVFCVASGKPKRLSLVKYILYACMALPLAYVFFELFTKGFSFENILCAVSAPYLDLVPVIGWTHGVFMGIVLGDTNSVIIYAALLLVFTAFCAFVFKRSKPDYFEDVLQKTESSYEWKKAVQTGKVTDAMMMGSKKVAVKRTGINHGFGASAFFFKQCRELSRRSRIPFININTAVVLIAVLLIGFGLGSLSEGTAPISLIMMVCAFLCCYLQFFFTVSDDWVKELQKPYIFLAPDSSVNKLVMASATSVIKPLIDGAIAFTVGGVLLSATVADIFSCAILYFSCGFLYTALNILVQRYMGKTGSRGVIMVVYMLLLALLITPGIVIAAFVFIGASCPLPLMCVLVCLPSAIWNMIASMLIYLLCKRSLNNMEY